MSLDKSNLRTVADALVIAIRYLDGHHEYNPRSDSVLRAGMVLIVLVKTEELPKLKLYLKGELHEEAAHG